MQVLGRSFMKQPRTHSPDFYRPRQPDGHSSPRAWHAESHRLGKPQASGARPRLRDALPRLSLAIAVPLIMVVVAGAVLPSRAGSQSPAGPPTQPAFGSAPEVEASVEPYVAPKPVRDADGDEPQKKGSARRKQGSENRRQGGETQGRETRKQGKAAGEARANVQPPVLDPPTPAKDPPADVPVVATRVVVPALGIDLPIVSGDLEVPGNPPRFPLCDVAQYLTSFGQPGEGRTTYLYAHARAGMFLPLLEGSMRDGGAAMMGALVEVNTDGPSTYLYQIFLVKPHAIDLSLANDVPPGEERLVLQTSEGPTGTVPKLQVAARLLEIRASPEAASTPPPEPRVCA